MNGMNIFTVLEKLARNKCDVFELVLGRAVGVLPRRSLRKIRTYGKKIVHHFVHQNLQNMVHMVKMERHEQIA